MREIKFRVWDKEKKIYLFWNEYKDEICEAMPFNCGDEWTERCIVEQYTGLKDKNEKEIFEGDILNVKMHGLVFPMVIKWDNSHSRFAIFRLGKLLKVHSGIGAQNSYHYEIIGNIHENPELLKEQV